jgi:hypothetical protein
MGMTTDITTHADRQRELLKGIVLDISDVEQIAFASGIDMAGRQQVIAEKLRSIRHTALAGINDHIIVDRILRGYRTDCLSKLGWLGDVCNKGIDGEIKDESLQEMALAATGFACSVEKYLALKNGSGTEVDHG